MIGTSDPAAQAAALARARRNATALLVVVAIAYFGAQYLPDTVAVDYLRAALEAGLIGGLADWFAVVALFRHPLGIPIPHTAVIPKSKEGLGQNLATFVEGNFLSEQQVRDRVADPEHLDRVADWLADPANADRLVARGAVVLDAVLEAVDEEDVVARAAASVRSRLRDVPTARLAGEGFAAAIEDGRHSELVTAAIEGIVQTMVDNRSSLRARLGEQSPSWVPPLVDDIVFDQAELVVRRFLQQMAAEPEHDLRVALDDQLLAMTTRLREDPAVQDRVDDVVQEVLSDELLQQWIGRWWEDVRVLVHAARREDANGARLRRPATEGVLGMADRLQHDPAWRTRAQHLLEALAAPVATIGQREVGGMIEATVERWDAEDTSSRLELWLGRDLQFVRINGTVVGALVGVVLHAITRVL